MPEEIGSLKEADFSSYINWFDLLRPTTAAILVAGDASVEDNQIDCRISAQERGGFNTLVAGATVRVAGNLFSGPFLPSVSGSPVPSAVTLGLLNTTIGNQATHCIKVDGISKVNHGNLSIACPLPEPEPVVAQALQVIEGSLEGDFHWLYEGVPYGDPVVEVLVQSPDPSTPDSYALVDEDNSGKSLGSFAVNGIRNGVPLDITFTVTLTRLANQSFTHVEHIDAQANQPGNVVAVWQKRKHSWMSNSWYGYVVGRMVFRPHT